MSEQPLKPAKEHTSNQTHHLLLQNDSPLSDLLCYYLQIWVEPTFLSTPLFTISSWLTPLFIKPLVSAGIQPLHLFSSPPLWNSATAAALSVIESTEPEQLLHESLPFSNSPHLWCLSGNLIFKAGEEVPFMVELIGYVMFSMLQHRGKKQDRFVSTKSVLHNTVISSKRNRKCSY